MGVWIVEMMEFGNENFRKLLNKELFVYCLVLLFIVMILLQGNDKVYFLDEYI